MLRACRAPPHVSLRTRVLRHQLGLLRTADAVTNRRVFLCVFFICQSGPLTSATFTLAYSSEKWLTFRALVQSTFTLAYDAFYDTGERDGTSWLF